MRKNYRFIFCALLLWIMCSSPPPLMAKHISMFQTGITITGVIKDESSSPLPGVNVLVKGTTTGTMTDGDGRYSINVPNNQVVLVFSFIGYAEQEVNVGSQSDISITMKPDEGFTGSSCDCIGY
jgi:hypothetical protein